MARRMLIDASAPGETRVAVVEGNQLLDYDFEDASRRQVKSSIFLAQVTRVEPSLQAAFLEYGAQRQGFLALPEIHPDYYKIPVSDREKLTAALKQSAAEVQAELESMDETGGDDSDDDGDDEGADTAAVQIDDVPLLTSFGRGELLVALSEMIGPQAPEGEAPVVLNNFFVPDNMTPMGIVEEETDNNGQPQQQRGWRGRRGRGRGGRFNNRREMDPEAMEAARRRQLLRSYKIQEVIKRRQVMLVQVNKEERGTKGAALTTYISLPGRYCVLMPNSSNAGGVSRKITNPADRRRMKEIVGGLKLPEGMGVILRTAGLECSQDEIAHDLDYLLRLWDSIREHTLKSTAPALIYEEGDLITRSIRDLYNDEISEILVSGQQGYESARSFMEMLLPSQVQRVKAYDARTPLFSRYHVDDQIDAVHEPTVQLPSGGYIVINQTEALVAIDVNSGRATRERNIEETAYRTNLEAATEVARQVRLRDLAGLIVVDFIDMEDYRHRIGVEKRMRDAMKSDRARTQVGRISTFGLLEMSRQRLRLSVVDAHFARCDHCNGTGWMRGMKSSARHIIRALEQELAKNTYERLTITLHSKLALELLNQFRVQVGEIEQRHNTTIVFATDDSITPPDYRLERQRAGRPPQGHQHGQQWREDALSPRQSAETEDGEETSGEGSFEEQENTSGNSSNYPSERGSPGTRRDGGRGRRFRGRDRHPQSDNAPTDVAGEANAEGESPSEENADPQAARDNSQRRGRRSRGQRGRGGGRGNGGQNDRAPQSDMAGTDQPDVSPEAFTNTKPYWNNNASGAAPAAAKTEAKSAAANSDTTPPQPITTAPVVTKIGAEGESNAEGDGTGRKGWWNKLMKA